MARTFFIPVPQKDAPLTTTIYGGDAHHLLNVLRKRVGDGIVCRDSHGQVYHAIIKSYVKDDQNHLRKQSTPHNKNKVSSLAPAVTLELNEIVAEEISSPASLNGIPEVVVFLSVPHPKTLSYVTAKLAECGAHTLELVLTERSFIQKSAKVNLERLERIANEAQKQSSLPRPMNIVPPRRLTDILSDKKYRDRFASTNIPHIVFWENERYTRQTRLPAKLEGMRKSMLGSDSVYGVNSIGGITEIDLFIGAEGGITFEEHRLLVEAGFSSASLHPTILKVDTAVMLAFAQAVMCVE